MWNCHMISGMPQVLLEYWGQGTNLLLATEMVPPETRGHEKILRLLSGWKESVWETSAQGHRTGLIGLEAGRLVGLGTASSLWKVSPVEEGTLPQDCHKPHWGSRGILECPVGSGRDTGAAETLPRIHRHWPGACTQRQAESKTFWPPTPYHNSGVLTCTWSPEGMSCCPKYRTGGGVAPVALLGCPAMPNAAGSCTPT